MGLFFQTFWPECLQNALISHYFSTKNDQKRQNKNFPKKGVGVNLYPLMGSKFLQNKWTRMDPGLNSNNPLIVSKWPRMAKICKTRIFLKKGFKSQLNTP